MNVRQSSSRLAINQWGDALKRSRARPFGRGGRGGGGRDGPYYTRVKIELHREIITASQRIDNWRNSGRRSFDRERRQWKSYHKPGGGIKVN